jgi:hypothetical protein
MKDEDFDFDIEDLLTQIRDLTLRVARLEQETTNTDHPTNDNRIELLVGDRVRIKNRIRRPANWPTSKPWTEANERSAVVTRVTTDRVYITTDNGTLTWRQPQNLKKTK